MSTETITQHTPGPWNAYVTDDGFAVYQTDERGTGDHVNCVKGDPESEANARIIAAAPKLLAALKRAVTTIHAWHDMHPGLSEEDKKTAWRIYSTNAPEMKAINTAIAEAEGRS